ncbi:hypothetical protein RUM43_009503 [Polyplax serrata]|uniref:Uncharacterized protein n=1 Tax=Polyplax serrata TaxID=468196 RepID=A0AAN8NQL9_POLSC
MKRSNAAAIQRDGKLPSPQEKKNDDPRQTTNDDNNNVDDDDDDDKKYENIQSCWKLGRRWPFGMRKQQEISGSVNKKRQKKRSFALVLMFKFGRKTMESSMEFFLFIW